MADKEHSKEHKKVEHQQFKTPVVKPEELKKAIIDKKQTEKKKQ